MISNDEYINNLSTEGFHIFRDVLPPTLLSSLRLEIDVAIRDDKIKGHTLGNYSYILQNKGGSFVALLEASPLQDYVDAVLGDTCILHSFNSISLIPKISNPIQNSMHRDSPRFCRPYLLAVQILYMIDDFTTDNGATYVLPGSHLSPDKPTESEFFSKSIRIVGNAGDAVIFDSMLWHAGGVNLTSTERRGVTKVFTRAFMKQQIDYTKATDPNVVKLLSPRSKRLLGFNARVPENLDQFFLPADQRLYKANQG